MVSNKSLGIPHPFGLPSPFPASITSSQQHLHTLSCYLESAAFSGCFPLTSAQHKGPRSHWGEAELQSLMPGAYSLSHWFSFLMVQLNHLEIQEPQQCWDSWNPNNAKYSGTVRSDVFSWACPGAVCGDEKENRKGELLCLPRPGELGMCYMSQPPLLVNPQELQRGWAHQRINLLFWGSGPISNLEQRWGPCSSHRISPGQDPIQPAGAFLFWGLESKWGC